MTGRPNARACVFFKNSAEAAARFYANTIPDTHIEDIQPLGEGMAVVMFRIMGTPFMALDGNRTFESRQEHSIAITTLDQAETDRVWADLTEGGSELRCGWCSDRFGIHWQVTPIAMTQMLGSPDREAASRAQAAMMDMRKIDIAAMKSAFEGRALQDGMRGM